MDQREPTANATTIAPRTLTARLAGSLRVITWRELGLLLVLAAAGWVADQVLPPAAVNAVAAVINIWVQIAIMVVSALLSYALAPKPVQPPKPSLQDFDFPTAEEGRAIPVVFGTVWISGPNVLWYGDLDTEAIKVKGGKK